MSRYELLIKSIAQADQFMTRMFLFSFALLAGYAALGWIESAVIRKASRVLYLVFVLVAFIFSTVYSALV